MSAEDLVPFWIVGPDGEIANASMMPAGRTMEVPPGYTLTFDDPTQPVVETVPDKVTLRQMLLALEAGGWITRAEALDAARVGAVPAPLEMLVAGMSEADVFATRLTWAAMYEALRADPLWTAIVAAGIATTEQVDDLFRDAAAR